MWLIDPTHVQQAGFFNASDFWQAFLVFIATYFSHKAHEATRGDR